MSKALKALNDKDVPVVEYGPQILFQWGWAEVLIVSNDQFLLMKKLS
jgi:hypothetical protein